jgi:Ca2+-binding RTX toxin-like protein
MTFDVRGTDGVSKGSFTQVHLGTFAPGGDSNAAVAGTNTIYVNSGGGVDSLRGGAGNDFLDGGAGNDTAATNGGNDTVEGGAGNDVITGGAGNEVLGGGAGNDSITIAAGTDNVSAGDGNDTIVAAANFNGADTIAAGDGTDVMTMSTAMADTNFANVTGLDSVAVTGNLAHTIGTTAEAAGITAVTMDAAGLQETLTATTYTTGISVDLSGGGIDRVQLSNANNTVSFSSNDELDSSAARDTITFGSGTDTIRADVDGTNVTIGTLDLDNITGLENIVVNGSTGTDVATLQFDAVTATATNTISIDASSLTGATDSLTVTNNAGANNDFFNITGTAGADTLQGAADVGAGGDTLAGGIGNDSLSGQNGNDSILGGAGSDTITVGAGSVNVSGGDANDTINMAATLTAADTVAGGDGTDTLTVTAALGTSADAAFANISTVETLQLAGAGATTLGTNAEAAGIDTISLDVAANAETVTLTAYTTAVTVDLNGGADDVVTLSNLDNTVAFGSNDELDGGTGNDSIAFGTGTDTIRADVDGTNQTVGTMDLDNITGLENIVVNASTGTDVVALTFDAVTDSASQTITIDASALTGVSDTIAITNNIGAVDKNFNITGGVAGDTLAGAQGTATSADTIVGGTGNDSLTGNGGLDILDGGVGNDSITGGASNDSIIGGAGSDAITANAGNDTINSGDSDDTITMAANFTFDDRIDGGAQGSGGDTLSVNGGVTDVNFLNTSNIENLTLATAGDNRLGFRAQAAGVTTVTMLDTADTVGASTYTTALAITMSNGADSIATGSGNDTLTFDSTDEVGATDTINFGSGSDTLTNTAVAGVANTLTADLDNVTGLESLILTGTTGVDVTTVNFAAVGGAITNTLTVDASSHITAGDQLIMSNLSNLATVNFNVTGSSVGQNTLQGGAGADTLVGGAANDSVIANGGNDTFTTGGGTDTINSGAGNDTIDLGAGADSILAAVGSDRITGGSGVDTYALSQANTSKFVYTTITDLTFGATAAERDILTFDASTNATAETFTTTALSLGTNATFADYLDAGTVSAGSEGELSWFQFSGNTYIVQDNSSNTTFDVANGDIVVELIGLLDLSVMTVGNGTLT